MKKDSTESDVSAVQCHANKLAGRNRWQEFARYPQYKEAYIRAFAKMLEHRAACGNKDVIGWKTPEGVFEWWMEDQSMEGQVSMVIEGNIITGFREKGERRTVDEGRF